MSEEQLKAFIEKVKGDTSLQEKLKSAADSDAVLAIVKDAGFSISADDLKNAQSELSEEELEGVAGGGFTNPIWICEALCGLANSGKVKTTAPGPGRGGCPI